MKYLLAIGCDKNYNESSFGSRIDNNPYIYAKMNRSDFYSKDVLALLRPDDYAKNKLYEDFIDLEIVGSYAAS